jgi:hypothetical protein
MGNLTRDGIVHRSLCHLPMLVNNCGNIYNDGMSLKNKSATTLTPNMPVCLILDRHSLASLSRTTVPPWSVLASTLRYLRKTAFPANIFSRHKNYFL